ncbi:YhcH/YjgK/YiaL family protein [Lacticaseibacillus jixiensis]|uniref:YhcH/YjgK/YiaL family protein n=1 Tax=Lacticaseibacillus jixiensis TaxID=3231926 RepID=UPI0036F3E08D
MYITNLKAPHFNLIHSTGLGKVLNFIENTDLAALKPGKLDVTPDINVTIQEYTTKTPAEGKFENHRDEVDIQLIVSGTELFKTADTAKLTMTQNDYAAHDISFFADPEDGVRDIVLSDGDLMVLFPEDAHKPCLDAGGKHEVKKLIFKVPLAQF